MAEHIAHAVAQLVADFADALVSRTAMRAVVAAVLDQRDFRAFRPEHVVARGIDGTVEAIVHDSRLKGEEAL